jgi:IrrE N-terminal-like domain
VARNADWEARESRQIRAGHLADTIVSQLGLTAPIDPLAIIVSESPLLLAQGGDFRNAYDGKLKYVRSARRFLLFYNNKYDERLAAGDHHPRTRFSIAHELGHYFIESHRHYLLGGGISHGSRSEFRNDNTIEREADSFAASILLPRALAEREFNSEALSIDRIHDIAAGFKASILCTAFRAVRLSEDPCGLVGIRDGRIVWMFRSDSLVRAGLYPKKTKDLVSHTAVRQWQLFPDAVTPGAATRTVAPDWFESYDRVDKYRDVEVMEYFLPVPVMETLVVLLTIDYDALFFEDKAGDGFDDADADPWTKERHDSGD